MSDIELKRTPFVTATAEKGSQILFTVDKILKTWVTSSSLREVELNEDRISDNFDFQLSSWKGKSNSTKMDCRFGLTMIELLKST